MTHAYRHLRLAGCLAALAITAACFGQEAGALAIRAKQWVGPDGALQPGGLLVIRGGLIAQVGGELPAGVEVVEFPEAVLSPGLIDVHAALTAVGQLDEPAQPLQPQARAADAFDRNRTELAKALAAGVTAFGLAPGDANVVGGRMAVCRTGGADGPRLMTDGPMKLSLSPAVYRGDREPTSRSGAVALLRRALAGGPDAPASAALLEPLVTGRIAGVFSAPQAAEVGPTLALQAEFKLRVAIRHEADAALVAADLKAAGAWAIVGPFDLQTPPRRSLAAARYEAAGVPVAITAGLPGLPADGLRVSAAVAARNGFSAAAARRAITRVPAEILGVAEQMGALEVGRLADVVVFDGDPLDLRSRVLAVFVDGRRMPLHSGH